MPQTRRRDTGSGGHALRGKTRGDRRPKGEPPLMRVCYICGRQFGSASLSIHEPQCMKKWEAEQDLLPPEQRRPRPVRPEVAETVRAGGGSGGMGGRSEIQAQNEAAYRSYDSNLSPCPHCGRTFNPDALQRHLKSCRPGSAHKPVAGRASSTQRDDPRRSSSSASGPRTPMESRQSSSRGPETPSIARRSPARSEGSTSSFDQGGGRAGGGRRSSSKTRGDRRPKGEPPLMRVCYICGRQFGSASLSIHEPQCMKKWEAEQDLLPPEQRRPRPVRP
eukprot:COSAG02_NODE_4015_length_5905_cov_2.481915_1_plen_276_part_10